MRKFVFALILICACFLFLSSNQAFAFTLIHDLPYQRSNGVTYSDVIATRDSLHTYYAYYDIPVNGSIPDITRYGFDWGISFGCNASACTSPGYHLYMITCDQNNNNCVDGYDTGIDNQVVGSTVGQPSCWDNAYVAVSRGFVWLHDYLGLCGVGDVTAGTFYGPVPPDSITAPLHDESSLIMTTSDNSNFATSVYFNVLKINHSGVDLALSANGSATASTDTARKIVHAICDGEVDFTYSTGGLYSFIKVHHPNCNGQDIIAYYGHMTPYQGLTTVSKDDPIGTVKNWVMATGNNSHLHLTIDTQTSRDLKSINKVVCNYQLDPVTYTVTSLSNCGPDTTLTKNKIRLKIGWGQVKTLAYKDSKGHLFTGINFYISEPAMRQLGFITFFDLY